MSEGRRRRKGECDEGDEHDGRATPVGGGGWGEAAKSPETEAVLRLSVARGWGTRTKIILQCIQLLITRERLGSQL